MDKKVYLRGMAGQLWYNFSEVFAYALLYRPTPKELVYEPKVFYGKEKKEYMNLSYPKNKGKEKLPLFIYIHGGGWISGITEMRNAYISNWAKSGFFTASVSYTLAPQKEYPFQLQEFFSAIDYLFDNAEKYGIDTDRVVISGESAGGYFLTFAAAVAADKSLAEKVGITFRHCDKFSLKALVSHSGCHNLKRLLDKEKPQSKFPDIKMMTTSFLGKRYNEAVSWLNTDEGRLSCPEVTEKFPPMFVTWCTRDMLRYEAFDLMKELDEKGIPYEQFKGDGAIGNHAWTIVTVFRKSRDCFEKSKNFVMKYINS